MCCQSPFLLINSVCVYVSSVTKSWCDAHQYCRQINGELLTGDTLINALNQNVVGSISHVSASYYWVGLSDMFNEQGSSRTGWRFTNGSVLPSVSFWQSGEPGNYAYQDCIDLDTSSNQLEDAGCGGKYNFICQPGYPRKTEMHFKLRSPFVSSVADHYSDSPCQNTYSTVSRLRCAFLCLKEEYGSCVAFYYHAASSQCILIRYADVRMQDKTDGWENFSTMN